MEFELPFYVRNGGDGSAIVEFAPTLAAAEASDDAQDEGWGESSAGIVKLKVEGGRLFFSDFMEIDGRFQRGWVRVE